MILDALTPYIDFTKIFLKNCCVNHYPHKTVEKVVTVVKKVVVCIVLTITLLLFCSFSNVVCEDLKTSLARPTPCFFSGERAVNPTVRFGQNAAIATSDTYDICASMIGSIPAESTTFNCEPPRLVRYVSLHLYDTHQTHLHINEIEVHGIC